MCCPKTIKYLTLLLAAIMLWGSSPNVHALGKSNHFRPAWIQYHQQIAPNTSGLQTLQNLLAARTSVRAGHTIPVVRLNAMELYKHPFIWMAGDQGFDKLPQKSINNLQRFLKYGGMMFVDDTSGQVNSKFHQSVMRMITRIFPDKDLTALPRNHAVYRSFYYLHGPAGRYQIADTLGGIAIDGRAAIIVSQNALTQALERQRDEWRYPIQSQRSDEREMALRLAVNLAVYALTVNYKLDQVHISYQLRHPDRYPEADSLSPSDDTGQR